MARLATLNDDGQVDLVPITFALLTPATLGADQLVTAVDHKPKTTTELRRLRNIERRPAVTILFDHYDDADWTALWWVRARGVARVIRDGADHDRAVDALVERYEQYQGQRPVGAAIWVEITDWHGWGA